MIGSSGAVPKSNFVISRTSKPDPTSPKHVPVPINVAAIEWDPLKPPADFRAIIQRWERLALVRVAVALVAFGAFTIAA